MEGVGCVTLDVAITGATGLIGSEVHAQLETKTNVDRIGRRDTCELYADFTEPASVEALELGGYDALVHCAGVVDADLEDPGTAFVHATTGTQALYENAVDAGVGRIAHFSTAHVYGPLEGEITESTPCNPLRDYGLAHFASEQVLRRNVRGAEVSASILRPCAVFGEPRNPHAFDRWHLIPFAFPISAVQDQRIELRSPGQQRRNFVSTGDLARCVLSILDEEHEPGVTVVNPVGPDTLSVRAFAERCASAYTAVTGTECEVQVPEPDGSSPDEPLRYTTEQQLCTPRTTVDAYLEPFIRWLIDRRDGGLELGAT